jgi:hypothetical protein
MLRKEICLLATSELDGEALIDECFVQCRFSPMILQ